MYTYIKRERAPESFWQAKKVKEAIRGKKI